MLPTCPAGACPPRPHAAPLVLWLVRGLYRRLSLLFAGSWAVRRAPLCPVGARGTESHRRLWICSYSGSHSVVFAPTDVQFRRWCTQSTGAVPIRSPRALWCTPPHIMCGVRDGRRPPDHTGLTACEASASLCGGGAAMGAGACNGQQWDRHRTLPRRSLPPVDLEPATAEQARGVGAGKGPEHGTLMALTVAGRDGAAGDERRGG